MKTWLCVGYRGRLPPGGLVVDLSWAERRRLRGCGGLGRLVELHAQTPRPHREEDKTGNHATS